MINPDTLAVAQLLARRYGPEAAVKARVIVERYGAEGSEDAAPCVNWPFAVHAFVPPRYELIAFDLPPCRDNPNRIVGWEIYSGPTFHDLVAKGDIAGLHVSSATIDTVMEHANRAWRRIRNEGPIEV
jgi:hypothetical protein